MRSLKFLFFTALLFAQVTQAQMLCEDALMDNSTFWSTAKSLGKDLDPQSQEFLSRNIEAMRQDPNIQIIDGSYISWSLKNPLSALTPKFLRSEKIRIFWPEASGMNEKKSDSNKEMVLTSLINYEMYQQRKNSGFFAKLTPEVSLKVEALTNRISILSQNYALSRYHRMQSNPALQALNFFRVKNPLLTPGLQKDGMLTDREAQRRQIAKKYIWKISTSWGMQKLQMIFTVSALATSAMLLQMYNDSDNYFAKLLQVDLDMSDADAAKVQLVLNESVVNPSASTDAKVIEWLNDQGQFDQQVDQFSKSLTEELNEQKK